MTDDGAPTGFGWFRRHTAELRLTVRVVVAAVLAYVLALLLDLDQPFWSVIASLLVLQGTIGASLQNSIDWMVGTIGGAVLGSLVGWAVPHDTVWSGALALAVALAPLGLLAAVDSRYRIAPITAVIALIVPRSPEIGPLAFILDRSAEIGLGALIAVGVSLLVLPARSHGLLAEAVNRVLLGLADVLPRLLPGLDAAAEKAVVDAFTDLRLKLAELDAAAEEARRERQIHFTNDPDPDPLVLAIVRLRNDAVMVLRVASRPMPDDLRRQLLPALTPLVAAGAAALRDIATAFQARKRPPPLAAYDAALAAYDAATEAIRTGAAAKAHPDETADELFTLSFAFDQFSANLRDLSARAAEFAPAAFRARAARSA